MAITRLDFATLTVSAGERHRCGPDDRPAFCRGVAGGPGIVLLFGMSGADLRIRDACRASSVSDRRLNRGDKPTVGM